MSGLVNANIFELAWYSGAKYCLNKFIASSPIPVIDPYNPLMAIDAPPNTVYKPSNPLIPIDLNSGFVELASFREIVILLNVVLNISAGKETKLPNGLRLNSWINAGTLLYVGKVFLVYHEAACLIASSISTLPPVSVVSNISLPAISLNHFLAFATSPLNKSFVKDLYQLYVNHFQTLSPPAYSLAAFSVNGFFSKNLAKPSTVSILPFLTSLKTAWSSDATMFSSSTPYLIPSSILASNLNSALASPLPALKISSATIAIASVAEALPPRTPLARGNIIAE